MLCQLGRAFIGEDDAIGRVREVRKKGKKSLPKEDGQIGEKRRKNGGEEDPRRWRRMKMSVGGKGAEEDDLPGAICKRGRGGGG